MLQRAFVKGKIAKVRSEPKRNAPLVDGLNMGTVVKLLDEDCGWSLIEWRQKHSDAVVGWMLNGDLQPLENQEERGGGVSMFMWLVGIGIPVLLCIALFIEERISDD